MISFRDIIAAYANVAWVTVSQCHARLYSPQAISRVPWFASSDASLRRAIRALYRIECTNENAKVSIGEGNYAPVSTFGIYAIAIPSTFVRTLDGIHLA